MRIFFLLLVLGIQLGYAQKLESLGESPSSSGPSRIKFKSQKEWVAARWYLIGEYSSQKITWIDGEVSRLEWSPECSAPPQTIFQLGEWGRLRIESESTPEERGRRLENLNSGSFLAVEWDPVKSTETLFFRARIKGVECRAQIQVKPKWTQAQVGPRPLLFLKPSGNHYYGKVFEIDYLEIARRAGIQFDVLLGYGRFSLPNREVGKAPYISLFPFVSARTEWLFPGQSRWGLTGLLEQFLYGFGGNSSQSVKLSDWSMGIFYQRTQAILQGFVWRLHAQVRHHVVDDFSILRSVAFENREAIYLPLGVSGQFFIGRRWATGLDFLYAFPNNWAGRGLRQNHLSGGWRSIYRMSDFLLLLNELSYRSYGLSGMPSEDILLWQLGVRLEL